MQALKRIPNVVNNILTDSASLLNGVLLFPVWYFVLSWGFWIRYVTRSFIKVYDKLGLQVIIGNFFAPFRRDRTFAGFFIGIVIRLFWTAFSLIILSILLLGLIVVVIAFYVGWIFISYVDIFDLLNIILVNNQYVEFSVSYTPVPSLLLPYFGIWLAIYVYMLIKNKYSKSIKAGHLTRKLRERVWQRLGFDPREIEPLYQGKKNDFILFLKKNKLNEQDFLSTKRWVLEKELAKESWKYWQDEYFYRVQGVDVGFVAGFLPELQHFSIDLTKEAARNELPHVYGRERELEKILTILDRPTNNNIILVGEAGSGKTSIVYSIAWLILGRRAGVDLPTIDFLVDPLLGKKVIELNTGGMVGGTTARGSLEARFNKALRELTKGETILFINQIQNLFQAGLIGYLTPIVRSTKFPIIATTTPKVFNNTIREYAEFTSEFEVLRVEPPGIVETIRILEGVVNDIERKSRVFYTYPAIHAAVELSERYIHDSVLPEKAVKVLIKALELGGSRTITISSIEQAIAEISGVPVGELSREESEKLLNLEQLLKERIIGQDEGVRTIAKALRRARTGVASQNRPIATLLFLGPTGVGKTLTAKTLTEVYFMPQSVVSVSERQLLKMIEKSFIRFDMSEFSEYGSVTGFIQRLTESIREKPFSLILLDEFEKAEPAIHNLFLQVFEDGRLTSKEGDTADFRNSIIIATSNAVTNVPDGVDVQVFVRAGLQDHFRPELVNRFDGVVMFHQLSPSDIQRIVVLELKKLCGRIQKEHEIKVTWTEELEIELAKLGYDPEFGARPLRRIIQDRIEDSLAKKLLRNELQFGEEYELSTSDLH